MIAEIISLEILSRGIPKGGANKPRALVAGHVLEQLSYRRKYYRIAKRFCNNKEAIAKKYNESPDLLEEHLHNGPIIEQELEYLAQKFPDNSETRPLVKEDLSCVKKFNAMVKEYAASLSTKT